MVEPTSSPVDLDVRPARPNKLTIEADKHKRETDERMELARLAYQERKEQRNFRLLVGILATLAVLAAFGVALYFGEKELARQIIMAAMPAGAIALGIGRQKDTPEPRS